MTKNPTIGDITRREVIRRALLSSGLALAATNTTLLTACAPSTRRAEQALLTPFTAEEIAWLDEVAETILPATETPGAKAAEVGAFIALMVTDTYSPDEQERFRSGMGSLEGECTGEYSTGFASATEEQRRALLERLDRVQWEQNEELPDDPPHYFRAIKQLTVLGYFTSEVGYTQAMRYAETPGRYDPCVPYIEGELSWARHA